MQIHAVLADMEAKIINQAKYLTHGLSVYLRDVFVQLQDIKKYYIYVTFVLHSFSVNKPFTVPKD